MYTKKHYGFWMTFNWLKGPFIYGFIYASLVSLVYLLVRKYFNIQLSLPWQPISVLGIAVAFYLGFKNNSSYDRTWEARKIWGAIVNNSRSLGASLVAFVQGPEQEKIRRELIYRHIAWLTALRFQLRLSRDWEHKEERIKGLYAPEISEDYFRKLDQEIIRYIAEEEYLSYKGKTNIATQILRKQTSRMQELSDAGYFDSFRHLHIHQLLNNLYDEQGKSERIKNTPFPRQYASATLWTSMIFALIVPFGMLDIFNNHDNVSCFLTIPMSALIIWIFFLMEKIGDYSENPFEGTYNDIPITSISRSIEIDLREMIDDADIPKPIAAENGFLM
jgi:putative membrane protein